MTPATQASTVDEYKLPVQVGLTVQSVRHVLAVPIAGPRRVVREG